MESAHPKCLQVQGLMASLLFMCECKPSGSQSKYDTMHNLHLTIYNYQYKKRRSSMKNRFMVGFGIDAWGSNHGHSGHICEWIAPPLQPFFSSEHGKFVYKSSRTGETLYF